jgi:hypothetical protein
MTTSLDPRLSRLGAELERACAADLAAKPKPRRLRLTRRTLLAAAVAAAVLGAAAAIAADQLSTSDVEKSLPAGTAALIGTNPTCTAVKAGVEYHCVLARPPAPEVSDWKGTVEPTVDATKHVNGGCRSLTSDGLEWQCYLGQAAVDQQIVGAGFLGQYAPEPGHG